MDMIKIRIQKLMDSLPQEATPVNIMRHILKLIREEYDSGFEV